MTFSSEEPADGRTPPVASGSREGPELEAMLARAEALGIRRWRVSLALGLSSAVSDDRGLTDR